MKARQRRWPAAIVPALCALVLACERPPVETEQGDYRGLGVESVTNPRIRAAKIAAIEIPEPLPPVEPGTPPASQIFQNLEVLGHLESAQFTRLMGAITTWVSPEQGCNYCHAGGNFAMEGPYTKTVSRRMLQMTQAINSRWKAHVGETGVTCYTCHGGQPVPARVWVTDPGPRVPGGMAGNKAGQNTAARAVGLTSLPYDPFAAFLADGNEIRVQSDTALPTGNRRSIKETEWTYALMIHLSDSLGVNCTYCHNSRSFMPWEASSPARVTAWHGIRMVREINEVYIQSVADVLPANRKGPAGDPLKVNCATCHQGLPQPLLGAQMLKDYPSLAAPGPQRAARAGVPAAADPSRP